MTAKVISGVIAIVCAVCCMGCCNTLQYMVPKRVPLYSTKVVNGTPELLRDVDLMFGDDKGWVQNKMPSAGWLSPNCWAVDHFIPAPIPDRVRVSWCVERTGTIHQQDVEVKKHCGAAFSGTIVFTITSNDRVQLGFTDQP